MPKPFNPNKALTPLYKFLDRVTYDGPTKQTDYEGVDAIRRALTDLTKLVAEFDAKQRAREAASE